MEAHTLHPEIVTRRAQYGDRAMQHLAWLEENPAARQDDKEGLVPFFEAQLNKLAKDIPLFSPKHPYHLLPTPIELSAIIDAFNAVENDPQIENDIWKSDDILGWLYESYNNYKKLAHKASGDKTEFNKVSIQSQVYTPRWVVQFLVDNSLGKLYLEMFPDSEIKQKYKIANAPNIQTRDRKPLTEIRLIDPSNGSGNFLLYAFDVFYDLYQDQIENYGADYETGDIPKLIIENNLHGIDLDDRAVQLAQLGLYIKAKRKKRNVKIEHFNIVSSDFFLPAYEEVKYIFEENIALGQREREIIADLWVDLQNAHKFGSLIKLEEKLNLRWFGSKKQEDSLQMAFFGEQELDNFETFRDDFFKHLQDAVANNADKQGLTFLNTKTQDAITFLHLLTQKYDVAVANPPYTDSADFGTELKAFIEENYKKPYKFNTNLYACFIKRCFDLIEENGKMALIHPLTFMYIKTFEDVRKFILEKTNINVFVDYGLSNLFGAVMVDPAFYVLEKKQSKNTSLFISLDQYTRTPNEKFKKDFCIEALEDYIENRHNKHNISLPQSKLNIIEGSPFIYWISDAFREKFKGKSIDTISDVKVGINSGDNEQFVRFWWEVEKDNISINYEEDTKKWVGYSKGGPFNKWYGNLWLKLNWENNGHELRNCKKAILRNEEFYLKTGITYSASGSKGVSFRYLPSNHIFDVGGSCVFPKGNIENDTLIAILNSKLSAYIADCLNPTVNTQVGDLKRIPFAEPNPDQEAVISNLALKNIDIKKTLCTYSIYETNFEKSPLSVFTQNGIRERILAFFNHENAELCKVLLHEAIINALIFEVYDLSAEDRAQVESKMGKSIGELSVEQEALDAYEDYLSMEEKNEDFVDAKNALKKHLDQLHIAETEALAKREIIENFATLYQSNNDLEEFCIRHQINPINVWYWFSQANVVPQGRAQSVVLEFLAAANRSLLTADDDGIIPLVTLPGEPQLHDLLEEHCLAEGFSAAQFMQLDSLLGRPLQAYLEHFFFKNLSDHLNLFMYLPKTPFIWHLSSGEHQGFEVYISIYKWNSDSLFLLKTKYIAKRKENLEYRQIQLQDSDSAQAQNEKEQIRYQLQEIVVFSKKIDELIAEGYHPILDDGVGKNIAPLQQKGMLRAEVLNAKQLQKYLNADW